MPYTINNSVENYSALINYIPPDGKCPAGANVVLAKGDNGALKTHSSARFWSKHGEIRMTQADKSAVGRRGFLCFLGIGVGIAVTPIALVAEANADSKSSTGKRKARYNANSKDVKTYYRVNRY